MLILAFYILSFSLFGNKAVGSDPDFVFTVLVVPAILFAGMWRPLQRFLSLRCMKELGKLSMYIFVWHTVVLKAYERFTADRLFMRQGLWIIAYLTLLIIFCLIYQLLEPKTRSTLKSKILSRNRTMNEEDIHHSDNL